MTVELWYNAQCGTARTVRAWLDGHGIEYDVRLYLEAPPTLAELRDVLDKADIAAADLLRAKEPLAADLGLRGATDEVAILTAMAAHPRLINRPVVIADDRAALCRPAETVATLFPAAV
ncbi:MAG: ArsC/Spx/MgsR family protein [Pseudomonadota bacterium]